VKGPEIWLGKFETNSSRRNIMPLVINTNVGSLNAQRNLVKSGMEMSTAMERLSSGLRINRAADDAAGLAISNRLTSSIRGLNQAVRNANDGLSLISTAEGAMAESTNILQRVRELAIQSANGIYSDSDRATLNAEVQQLISELDRIAETTTFNGRSLLDGSFGKSELQVGTEANQTISVEIGALDAQSLGMGSQSVDLVGQEHNLGAVTIDYNEVLVNGQSIMAIGETWAAADGYDDLIDKINTNVNGVTATMQVSVTADDPGDGVLSGGNSLTVTLNNLDGTSSSVEIIDTTNINELVDKLNAESNGLLSASLDEDNKLVISAEGVSDIAFTDTASATGTLTAKNASIALTADNGDSITVSHGGVGLTADLTNFGFRENNESGVIEGQAVGAGAFEVGDLKINGIDVGESDSAGLLDKIDAINSVSDQTGVTATAFSTVQFDADEATGAWAAGDFTINGEVITSGADVDALVTAINGVTDATGVTAIKSGTTVILEGDTTQIAFGDASGTADNGAALIAILGAGVTLADAAGGIKLTSDSGSSFSVEHADAAAKTSSGLLDANVASNGSFGASLSAINVSTAGAAQKALDVIDNALNTISDTRAQLGAVSNRLQFTVSNLMNVSENTVAARSRIMDADFAAETAALSKAQVLQQASSAMLAQANAAPQLVLSLLR
jgi:flagellin